MDFLNLKQSADGMLRTEVYAEIFRYARGASEGCFVEVGAAHGASTIAMAWALTDRPGRVYAFETGNEMRHVAYRGPRSVNLHILDSNLKKFGIADRVTVIPDNVSSIEDWGSREPIALLLLDADGVIDRDLKLFYNHLVPGAAVIIDDYVNVRDLAGHGLNPLGKQYSTYCYVNYLLAAGLLEQTAVIDRTFFGFKPAGRSSPAHLDVAALDRIRSEMCDERAEIDRRLAEARAARADLAWLTTRSTAPDLAHIPSMTHSGVLEHLYRCASSLRGLGDVVEVGSWLGASCAYIAAGIRDLALDAPPTIHCFDQWKATQYEVNRAAGNDPFCLPGQRNLSLSVGQDLSANFLNNVIPIHPRIKAMKCDIGTASWTGRWIELLHDDGSKSAENFRHVLRTFGPSFIPGVTLVVLSDYHYWRQPHCPEEQRKAMRAQTDFMEAHTDCFELIWETDAASAATFLYAKPMDFTLL